MFISTDERGGVTLSGNCCETKAVTVIESLDAGLIWMMAVVVLHLLPHVRPAFCWDDDGGSSCDQATG